MFTSLFKERRRSHAVRNLSGPEALINSALDRFVTAASSAFVAPISAVSLIHGQEQTVKAGHGVPTGSYNRNESFCSFVLDTAVVLECCTPESDLRFERLSTVVGEPHIRYYIGAPLRLSNGIDVGALCVVDTVHRSPASADQKAYLLGLARQAALTLENRLDLWEHAT